MATHLSVERFRDAWEQSRSITEVSVRLVRAGYPLMSPEFVLGHALVLRNIGLVLKNIPRSDLPDYHDEDRRVVVVAEKRAGDRTAPVLAAAPEVGATCVAALVDGQREAWSREAGPDFVSWYARELWPFRAGSND